MKYGPLMVDVLSTKLTNDECQMIRNPLVGGVILFARNFEDKQQLRALVQSIRAVKDNLLIAVDHEGGRVQRFRDGFFRIPSMRSLGELFDQDQLNALEGAKAIGWSLAAELLELGIDFSFTPVLDVDHGISDVIGDRAFHSQHDIIEQLAKALILGMNEAGMKAVGKHFPGHGSVEVDSHVGIPVDNRALTAIEQEDMEPFKRLIQFGISAIMPAHIIYSAVDDKPAGFSPIWLQQTLRQRLGFNGMIISDDIVMEGASAIGNYAQRVTAALDAGCNMVLICNNPLAVKEVLDVIEFNGNNDSYFEAMKGKITLSFDEIMRHPFWKEAKNVTQLINTESLEWNG